MTDLGFCEHETGGDLEALGSGEILVLSEVLLQLEQLLGREGCPRPPSLTKQAVTSHTCIRKAERGNA